MAANRRERASRQQAGMNRRIFLSGMGALGLSALMQGCQGSLTPLRLVSHHWPGYEFMFLAQREGWISPQDSILVETGSATESMQLMATGKADGAALTLDELLRAREQGLPLMAVLVFDISVGADVLLAKPGIETLAQLKGKRIGFEDSAVGALMLHKALEAASLKLGDVKTVPVTFERHVQTWNSGEIDALITFEPASSQLLAKDALRLFDSSRIPDTIFDVLAVMPAAVERHRDALRKLVAAHFQGLRNFRKNPHDMAYRMADSFKLPPAEVIGAFKGLELPNESRNRKLLQGRDAVIVKTAHDLGVIMAQIGLLKNQQTDLSDLVSAGFIPWEETR